MSMSTSTFLAQVCDKAGAKSAAAATHEPGLGEFEESVELLPTLGFGRAGGLTVSKRGLLQVFCGFKRSTHEADNVRALSCPA